MALSGTVAQLGAFIETQAIRGKGALCIMLVVTDHARQSGFPLDQADLLAPQGGQVKTSKAAVQKVLARHGETRVLAAEGGRTNRGNIANMRAYVDLLNSIHAAGGLDLEEVETFWVERVRAFFAAKPFKLQLDASRSRRSVVAGVLEQAVARQKDNPGMQYAGTVMQHLVGAKLDCALGAGGFEHHSASTSDQQGGRAGDFVIEDVAVHVTTFPGEAVVGRCRLNIQAGLRPVLVTLGDKVSTAEVIAENAGLADRIDVFGAEQFIALNLYEIGKFSSDGRRTAIEEVVGRYNEIIDEHETDPSLKIDLA